MSADLALAGASTALGALRAALRALAPLDAPVLVVGERGVGRYACAETLHHEGPAPTQPFRVLAPDQVEDFTAILASMASAESASPELGRPTIYLEDVENIPPPLQAAIAATLRSQPQVRVIAGAGPNLAELVQLKRFDHDLFTLLSRVTVHVPPLRDRLADVSAIARAHDAANGLGAAALAALTDYTWPGNILELVDVLERARRLCARSQLTAGVIRRVLGNRPRRYRGFDVMPLRDLEQRYLLTVMVRFGGNRSRAAHHLGISRNTLTRKLRALMGLRASRTPTPTCSTLAHR